MNRNEFPSVGMEARVGIVGSAVLGRVLGWICFSLTRSPRGTLGMRSRAILFTTATFAGAAALALLHVGSDGAVTTSIGFGVGALAESAVSGIRQSASSINQNGG